MSGDIRTGRKARKIMTIMAAVFAVAMMLAVPLLSAVDTDADFTGDEAGYSVKMDDPTDAQMTKMGTSKSIEIRVAIYSELMIFNQIIFDEPVITMDSFSYVTAQGEKIESDKCTYIRDREVVAKNVTITYTAKASGSLFSEYAAVEPYKAAADAIKGEFGDTVAKDQKLVIKGDIKVRIASQSVQDCLLLDDSKCVISKISTTTYVVEDVDMTVNFGEKSVRMISSVKGVGVDEDKYEYDESPVKVGTTYTIKNSVDTSYSGDIYYKVADKDYSIMEKVKASPDEKGTVTELLDQKNMVISELLKHAIDVLPQTEEGMKVEKTYSAADSAFSDVVMDAVGNDLLKLILIIVGVVIGIIVLIVILIIVVIVLKKKKK